MEQELHTLLEHLSSPPVVSGVRVTRSVVLYACFVDRCLSFCTFSFGHCAVCSSIYGFLLPLCYLQTLHVEQAEKALYCVHKLVRKDALPVDIQLLRLDSMIEPILIDVSEVWGYENLKFIEQIHLKFCKRVLQVRNITPNIMVLGELGRFPIEVIVKLRMISFWSKLIQNESKLSSILYKLMLSLYEENQQTFKWIKCVESIFNEVGLGYVFQNQVGYFDKNMVKQI